MPKPNAAMREEARRGLDWRKEHGRGGTQVGVSRARDIVNNRDLSIETVKRMRSYFARHEVDKEAEGWRPGEDGYPSAGRIAWALWGGNAGRSFANRVLDSLETKMSQEIRTLDTGVEIRADENGIKVSGYAAVFDEETNIGGQFMEKIARGAFVDAVDRDDVVFLINHEGLPLARTRSGTLTLREDERGLYMESDLDENDPDVRALVPKMKRGDLDKMSFAFRPTRQSWDDSGNIPTRTIEEASLYDVSIVTTPAYEGTEIGLRSLEAHRADQQISHAARRLRMKSKL